MTAVRRAHIGADPEDAADEAIMIGEGIEVRILRVGRDGVRIGIVAPPEVRAHRREIYDQIRDANQSALVKAREARFSRRETQKAR